MEAYKKLKKTLLISGIYVILLGVLLMSMTLARYQDSVVAYSSFGASNFNAVILGENTLENLTDNTGEIRAFGEGVITCQYRPGQVWNEDADENSAQIFPFTVANGISTENSSQVGVSYQIKLITTTNLPLRYRLCQWTGNSSAESGGDCRYYEILKKEELDDFEGMGHCYKYSFADASGEEAVFNLQGGALDLGRHDLILEWPASEDTQNYNDTSYMKEVDVLQLLVEASSINQLGQDGYGDQGTGAEEPERYQTGLIVLSPDKGTEIAYTIDYRSFHEPEEESTNEKLYEFRIDNGIRGDVADTIQATAYVSYTIKLKIPVVDAGADWSYQLEYYDEEEQAYRILEAKEEAEAGEQEEGYRILSFPETAYLSNQITDSVTGELKSNFDENLYQLRIQSQSGEPVNAGWLEEHGFGSKLTCVLEAQYTDER